MLAAMDAWRTGFQRENPGVTVNYDPSGSGAGREQFISGAIAFGASDTFLTGDEQAAANQRCGGEALNRPHYIAPIAVAFNLPGIESVNMTPDVMAAVFARQITRWNDPAIQADNPDLDLPDTAIVPVHRADDSGTTANFLQYLEAAAPSVWTYGATGSWPLAGGESAQGTSGVVAAVNQAPGLIGYLDASQVGTLGTVAVKVGDEFVSYSPEAAAAVVDISPRVEGEDRSPLDGAVILERDTAEAGIYPIVLIAYHLICTRYPDQQTVDLVQSFMDYVISEAGQDIAAQNAGSAPISDQLREESQQAIDAIQVG
jgi:phosphate transport system substrate-binding protein